MIVKEHIWSLIVSRSWSVENRFPTSLTLVVSIEKNPKCL